MKLALAFLFGFVLVKCQPQVYNLNPKFFNPLLYNGPRALNSPSPYYVQNPQNGAIFFNPYGALGDGGFQEHEENESRYNLNKNKLTSGETDRDLIAVPRLFLNIASTGSSVPPVGQFLLRTVISTTVITTTIASVSKCIPATEFANAAPTPCARRRREVAEFLDRLALFDDGRHKTTSTEALAPSAVERVGTTAFVTKEGPIIGRFLPSDLLSSKEEEAEMQKRTKRFFNLLAVTTTITSYSFVTSVVNKQFNVITAAAKCDGTNDGLNCLLCVPPGFGVCA